MLRVVHHLLWFVVDEVLLALVKRYVICPVKAILFVFRDLPTVLIADSLARLVRALKITALMGGVVIAIWLACRYKLLGSLYGTLT